MTTCSSCHRPCTVTLRVVVRIGSRRVEWDECVTCWIEARRRDAEAAPAQRRRAA